MALESVNLNQFYAGLCNKYLASIHLSRVFLKVASGGSHFQIVLLGAKPTSMRQNN